MTDLYLVFANLAEADAHLLDAQGNQLHVNTDTIGTLYDVDLTDPEAPVYTALSGWHVNVRADEYAPELEAFRVYPASPRRVWA